VRKLFDKVKSREGYIRELVMAAIVVLVLFLDIFRMARMGWNYLDMNSSWTIATESLKNKALTGVGWVILWKLFNGGDRQVST